MSTYGYKYTDVHMHLHMHMYTYIHINTSTTPIVKLLTARLPSLQEHRIRASVLRIGLEQESLRFVKDMFLEDLQADVAPQVETTPNTVKAYVLLHEPQLWLSFCSMDLREQSERQGRAASSNTYVEPPNPVSFSCRPQIRSMENL